MITHEVIVDILGIRLVKLTVCPSSYKFKIRAVFGIGKRRFSKTFIGRIPINENGSHKIVKNKLKEICYERRIR